MIDAGESEDNIASVMKRYSPAPTSFVKPAVGSSGAKGGTEPGTFGGGVLNSITSGEAPKAALKGALGYAQGAIADIPSSLWGMAKLGASMSPDALVGNLIRGERPPIIDAAKSFYNLPSNVWEAGKQAGSHPQEFGRIMGQLTGQGPIMDAAIGGIPEGTFGSEERIPSAIETAPKVMKTVAGPVIRKLGGPVESMGNLAVFGKSLAPWGKVGKVGLIGSGLQKLGQGMKEFGIPIEDLNAAALRDFWGGNRPGLVTGPTEPPSISSGGEPDILDQLLQERRPKPSESFTATPPTNPITHEFNQPLPNTDIQLKPPTEQEPHLPFDSPSDPSEGQGRLFEDPPFTPNPRLARLSTFKIQEPTPFKLAEAERNGFVPDGPPAEDGSIRVVRKSDPNVPPESAGTPEPRPSKGPKGPDVVSLKGLSSEDIQALKDKGYKPGGIGPDGFAQLKSPFEPTPVPPKQTPKTRTPQPQQLDIPEQPPYTGQGNLFPNDLHTRSQLENIGRNGDFELTPSPRDTGIDPRQGGFNLEFDPRSTDPNQLSFPRKQFRSPQGFRMADLEAFKQSLDPGEKAEFLGHNYAQQELKELRARDAGGKPGLTVNDNSYPDAQIKSYELIYRDSDGKIIGRVKANNYNKETGRFGNEDPLGATSFVIDKDAGIAQGPAVLEMLKKMKELGVKGPSGMYSDYTAHLPESLKRFADDFPPDYVKPEDAPTKPNVKKSNRWR